MSEETARTDIGKKTIVYELPEMQAVQVRRDVEYAPGESGPLVLDLYLPPSHTAADRTPIVVFVFGFPGEKFGQGFRNMGAYVSWAKLFAASGIAAVTHTYDNPETNLSTLLQYLRRNAATLGIDETRMALWACSGNVPMALSTLITQPHDAFRCAVLSYGYMFDFEGCTAVAQAAAMFGCVNPSNGQSVENMPEKLPILTVRAGHDQLPGLNATIDDFVAKLLAKNRPLTLVNYPEGVHSFDILDDSEGAREVIRTTVRFVSDRLTL